VILVFLFILIHPVKSFAGPVDAPDIASSAFELVNAVNALRTSNGLPAYGISPILMFTAQNQADFMAANGIVTHSGPGGIGLTDRLLAAGYPLAGDLSLGGFRAENITSGSESMPAQSAVDRWTGDAPHLNTMLSPNLSEIGAGVSIANGRVYYVIDAALPTTGGPPQDVTPVVGSGSTVPLPNEALIPVVVINTPNQSGDVVHEVLAGQTLWQIAVAYDVRIDDIKRLNNLFDDNIYPGEKLLISKVAFATGAFTVETATVEVTATHQPVATNTSLSTPRSTTVTSIPTYSSQLPAMSSDGSTVMVIMVGIIALAIIGGGLFSWFGSSQRE
jgi:LysM repeat protein